MAEHRVELVKLFDALEERLLLGVREQQPTVDLFPQNPIFGNQILITKQQLLIDGHRDAGQDTRPIHELSPVSFVGQARELYGSLSDPTKAGGQP